ncbi:MAG: FAD-dependent oxidoreductase [Anaerolineales bacterium]
MKLSTEILVIGAGATGLGIAWDACLRGYKVIVLEQGDLAEGTSGRYHGLLHSGARYAVSDPASAADCAAENAILRQVVSPCIEDTGGVFLVLPGDPPEYPDRWQRACQSASVPVEEIPPSRILQREPALPHGMERAFHVKDAALDSFQLLHSLARSIEEAGGQVRLRHAGLRFLRHRSRVTGVEVQDRRTGRTLRIESELIVNAAGPWAGRVASRAGLRLPLALSRGTMIAFAGRPVQTVVNRCTFPGDGDIVVPIGTVAVLGTTDEPVSAPDHTQIETDEVQALVRLGRVLLPDIDQHRLLRAWVGIRPLYRPPGGRSSQTRSLPRAHYILDHDALHGVPGLISVLGGKLTTYRRMAEQTVDVAASQLGARRPCQTSSTSLRGARHHPYHRLPDRLARLDRGPAKGPHEIVCECELVTRHDIHDALERAPTTDLDDLRRGLRLGMGPCQAAFCAYRAADIVRKSMPQAPADGGLIPFLEERWRGIRALAWGPMLRQVELNQRITFELLGAAAPKTGPS